MTRSFAPDRLPLPRPSAGARFADGPTRGLATGLVARHLSCAPGARRPQAATVRANRQGRVACLSNRKQKSVLIRV